MKKSVMYTANIITICRILLSSVLIFLSPTSVAFIVIYILCGLSDMADGFIARKTHTESKTGAKLDSVADIVFLAVCAIKILPILNLKIWIWAWIAVIFAVKIADMILHFIRKKAFPLTHSVPNKITGVVLFILPLTITFINVQYSAVFVCAVATFSAIWDIVKPTE